MYYASLGTKEIVKDFNPQMEHTVICKRKQTHKQANRLQGKCVCVCVSHIKDIFKFLSECTGRIIISIFIV